MQFAPVLTLIIASSLCVSKSCATEPGELDGRWIELVEVPSREEHPSPIFPHAPQTLVIDGTLFVTKVGDRTTRQSLINFELPGEPKAADLMTVVGEEFWLTRAIYKVEGDILMICESTRDGARPTDFRRRKGIDEELTLLATFKRKVEPPAASLRE